MCFNINLKHDLDLGFKLNEAVPFDNLAGNEIMKLGFMCPLP